jgi:hypothetical protein
MRIEIEKEKYLYLSAELLALTTRLRNAGFTVTEFFDDNEYTIRIADVVRT